MCLLCSFVAMPREMPAISTKLLQYCPAVFNPAVSLPVMVSFTSSEFALWTLLPEYFMESLNEWAFEFPGFNFSFTASVPKKYKGTFKDKKQYLLYKLIYFTTQRKYKMSRSRTGEKIGSYMQFSSYPWCRCRQVLASRFGFSQVSDFLSCNSSCHEVLPMPSETVWLLSGFE